MPHSMIPDGATDSNQARPLKLALKVTFSLAILAWLIRSDYLNWAELRQLIHPLYLPLTVLAAGLAQLLQSQRFRMLLKVQGINISVREGWRLQMIGQFFNFVLPGGVTGDVVKAYYIKKGHGQSSKTSPYTVIFDRFLGIYSLTIMALISLIADWEHFSQNPKLRSMGVFVVAVFSALSFLLLIASLRKFRTLFFGLADRFFQRSKGIMHNLITSMEFFFRAPRKMLGAVLLSFVSQIFSYLALYFMTLAVGFWNPPLSLYFVGCSLGFMLATIPISPGGIGVGQAAFLFVFSIFLQQKSSLGPTLISGWQAVIFLWSLTGLYYYITYRSPKPLKLPN